MPDEQNIKKQIGIIQKILDIFRQIFNLQTQLEKQQLEEMIRKIAKEEGVDDEVLLAVIKCESGLNPKAINKNPNGTTDYGIIQANSYWYIEKMRLLTIDEALNNPEKCVRIMAKRFKQGAADDWICFKTGRYIPFLKVGY